MKLINMKKGLILLLLIFSNISFSQSKEGMEICLAMQSNNIMSDTDAEDALDKILDVIGASKNFALIPCDKISNAVATAYKGTRYILYDKKFMSLINQNTNDWSSLFILAHEVGHHINGHSLDILLYASDAVDMPTLEKKREQELEADEFAAFVLAKLGANLSQLNKVIELISDNSDDTFSTHPNLEKRLARVSEGYKNGFVEKENSYSKNKIVFVEKHKKEIYGDWTRYTFSNNDPFGEKKSPIVIVKGIIVGESELLKNAPDLMIDFNGYKPSYFFIFQNIKEIEQFIGEVEKLKAYTRFSGTRFERIEVKVFNSKGDQIRSNKWNRDTLLFTSDSRFSATFYRREDQTKLKLNPIKIAAGKLNLDLDLNALKKGTKFSVYLPTS